MKFSRYILAIALLVPSILVPVSAQLILESSREEPRDGAYGSMLKEDTALWISAALVGENATLTMQPFAAAGSENRRTVSLATAIIAMARNHYSLGKDGHFVVHADPQGGWNLSQIDDTSVKVRRTVQIASMSFAAEALGTSAGYVVGGVNQESVPAVFFLDKTLQRQWQASLPISKSGEISSLFSHAGRLFAVSNYEDASAYLYELSPNGEVLKAVRLQGGGAVGVGLNSGAGIALTYRSGRQVYVEKMNAELKTLWVTKLHVIDGASAKYPRLLELPGQIGWVGANKGRLAVYRLNADGVIRRTSFDNSTALRVPPSRTYSSIAVGDDIHIRGQARRDSDSGGGGITTFHFIERAGK